MTEFEYFKEDIKNLIKKLSSTPYYIRSYNVSKVNDKQHSKHQSLITNLKLVDKIKTKYNANKTNESLKDQLVLLEKKINRIVINNLFPDEANLLLNIETKLQIIPFLIKIKKLEIPIDFTINFEEKLQSENFPQQIVIELEKIDLFAQTFLCSENEKEKLLNNYINNYMLKVKNAESWMNNSNYTDEVRNIISNYKIEKEKKKLDRLITEIQPSQNQKLKL
jgi:hypothetical protein